MRSSIENEKYKANALLLFSAILILNLLIVPLNSHLLPDHLVTKLLGWIARSHRSEYFFMLLYFYKLPERLAPVQKHLVAN